jgi:hypothetical protein
MPPSFIQENMARVSKLRISRAPGRLLGLLPLSFSVAYYGANAPLNLHRYHCCWTSTTALPPLSSGFQLQNYWRPVVTEGISVVSPLNFYVCRNPVFPNFVSEMRGPHPYTQSLIYPSSATPIHIAIVPWGTTLALSVPP